MKLIAHRGNTHGPEEDKENSPDYIDKCLWIHTYDSIILIPMQIIYIDDAIYRTLS